MVYSFASWAAGPSLPGPGFAAAEVAALEVAGDNFPVGTAVGYIAGLGAAHNFVVPSVVQNYEHRPARLHAFVPLAFADDKIAVPGFACWPGFAFPYWQA